MIYVTKEINVTVTVYDKVTVIVGKSRRNGSLVGKFESWGG